MFESIYIDWITSDAKKLLIHDELLQNRIKFWDYVINIPKYQQFTEFVTHLLGIPSSEGCCERAFWH